MAKIPGQKAAHNDVTKATAQKILREVDRAVNRPGDRQPPTK